MCQYQKTGNIMKVCIKVLAGIESKKPGCRDRAFLVRIDCRKKLAFTGRFNNEVDDSFRHKDLFYDG